MTILALGGLLMPILLTAGYPPKSALGLLTGAGSLGLLFPPCLPLILYAIVAKISIEDMFLGGFVPGILMVALTAWWGTTQGPKRTVNRQLFVLGEAKTAIWNAKWELLLPAVAFAGLFGGIATPVEAAALTALYAWVVETFVYRDLKVFRDAPRVMTECGLLVGGVLLILGVALGFTNYLVDAQIAERAVEWVTGIHSFAMGVSSSAESVPPRGRMPDGHLFRHRRGGAVDHTHRVGIRNRPSASGHHFPGKPGIGLSDSSSGDEPFSFLVPILQALVGGVPFDPSNSISFPGRCTMHHLCSVVDNRIANGPGPLGSLALAVDRRNHGIRVFEVPEWSVRRCRCLNQQIWHQP